MVRRKYPARKSCGDRGKYETLQPRILPRDEIVIFHGNKYTNRVSSLHTPLASYTGVNYSRYLLKVRDTLSIGSHCIVSDDMRGFYHFIFHKFACIFMLYKKKKFQKAHRPFAILSRPHIHSQKRSTTARYFLGPFCTRQTRTESRET